VRKFELPLPPGSPQPKHTPPQHHAFRMNMWRQRVDQESFWNFIHPLTSPLQVRNSIMLLWTPHPDSETVVAEQYNAMCVPSISLAVTDAKTSFHRKRHEAPHPYSSKISSAIMTCIHCICISYLNEWKAAIGLQALSNSAGSHQARLKIPISIVPVFNCPSH
jgi:hypothetical protein